MLPFSIDPTAVALAAIVSPIALWAFRAGVRWAANGIYVRKDVFQTRMDALDAEVEQVRKNTDQIITHLLRE